MSWKRSTSPYGTVAEPAIIIKHRRDGSVKRRIFIGMRRARRVNLLHRPGAACLRHVAAFVSECHQLEAERPAN